MFQKEWEVLVVDDDPDVLAVSRLALRSVKVYGVPLKIHTCGSMAEAVELFNTKADLLPALAVALIDVVMETDTAGLDLCRYVREERKNPLTQLFIRTGQPGVAPERAVIDRYKNHDMPLGWLLPNDGYGAGYGQTETLDGNIQNLKSLTDYAHKNGVEIGLWTQSDLHPKDSISALLQRDIVKEVRDAGVRVLKTDVAWVGWGYSFGLNGVADVGHIMPYYGNDARPFIISLDGWAGTQRYAGVWSGDQTGGQWEYIRFHIPTYIGSGLSGQPNITSDMDGIFGGKNLVMNTRDFQWKTWTPMELNMDGTLHETPPGEQLRFLNGEPVPPETE